MVYFRSSKKSLRLIDVETFSAPCGTATKQLALMYFGILEQKENGAGIDLGGNDKFDHEWFYRSRLNDVKRNRWF